MSNPHVKVSRELKAELVQGALLIASLELVPLTQGNLSMRDPESGLFLITPHDLPYDVMTPEDIVVVDLAGNVVEGWRQSSNETQVHLAVYEQRPEVMAVVHAEPVFTNAFGVLHKPIAPVHVGMAIDVGGAVPVMPFMPSGSREFGYEMLKVMGDKNAVIWANHGMLAVGKSLNRAIHCTVMVEVGARTYHAALSLNLGEPFAISDETLHSLVG